MQVNPLTHDTSSHGPECECEICAYLDLERTYQIALEQILEEEQ
jgi:hypothetical protein